MASSRSPAALDFCKHTGGSAWESGQGACMSEVPFKEQHAECNTKARCVLGSSIPEHNYAEHIRKVRCELGSDILKHKTRRAHTRVMYGQSSDTLQAQKARRARPKDGEKARTLPVLSGPRRRHHLQERQRAKGDAEIDVSHQVLSCPTSPVPNPNSSRAHIIPLTAGFFAAGAVSSVSASSVGGLF